MSDGKNRYWCWVLVAALVCVAIFTFAEYRELKSKVKALWIADVQVLITTSDNNTNVQPSFVQVAYEDEFGLPKFNVSQKPPGEMRVLVASVQAFNFEVAADGYVSKSITIDGGGEKEVTVKLDRK